MSHNALRASGQPDRHLECRSHATRIMRHAAILPTARMLKLAVVRTSPRSQKHTTTFCTTTPRPTHSARGPCDDRARMRCLTRTSPTLHLAPSSLCSESHTHGTANADPDRIRTHQATTMSVLHADRIGQTSTPFLQCNAPGNSCSCTRTEIRPSAHSDQTPSLGKAAPPRRGSQRTAGQWSARSPPRQALSRTLGNTPRCDPHVHKCSGTQRRTPDQTFRHFRISSVLHQHPEHPDQPRARPDRAAIGPGCEASAELRQLYTSRQVVFAESQTPSPRTHRKRLSEPHLHRI